MTMTDSSVQILSMHVQYLVVLGSLTHSLTHSLTAALDQLMVVASSTSNDPGPRSGQHQQIGQCLDAKRLTRRLERTYAAANRRAAAATGASSTAVGSDAAAVTKAAAARTVWYDQRRTYRQLRRSKCTDYWRNKVEANESDPRQLWRLVDDLLGRGRVPASSAFDVETLMGGSTLGPGGHRPPKCWPALPPNILVPTAKIRVLKI